MQEFPRRYRQAFANSAARTSSDPCSSSSTVFCKFGQYAYLTCLEEAAAAG